MIIRIFPSLIIISLLSACSTSTSDELKAGPVKSADFPLWTVGSSKHAELEKAFRQDKMDEGLNRRAVSTAINTEYAALEKGKAGAPVSWNHSEAISGKITPSQPYQVGSSSCRRYVHEVMANGATRKHSATACREANGNWVPLT